jgi:uncharacterized protein
MGKPSKRKEEKLLIDAVYDGNIAAARALLDAGVDPNITTNDPDDNERGLTPLMLAAEDPNRLDLLDALLSHGAHPNRATKKGTTALSIAVDHGNAGAVARLIAARARAPGTVLSAAVYRSDAPLLRQLLPAVDDVNAVGGRDHPFSFRSPLDGAVQQRRLAFVMLPELRATAESTADARAYLHRHEDEELVYFEIIRDLIAAGADVNRVNFAMAPLYSAAACGDVEVVKLLLDAGAKPDAAISVRFPRGGDYSDAALHAASCEGHLDVVRALLAAGADVNKLTAAGHTPLDLATSASRSDVAEVLRRAGGTLAKPVPAPAASEWELNL